MKFTLSWLRTHFESSAPIDDMTKTLNAIGLEVDAVSRPAEHLEGFRVAEILRVRRHPDADRLQVCDVAAGEGFENVQVVCGARNARAGLRTIFAPPGTKIPANGLTIKAGTIRGGTEGASFSAGAP